MYRNLHSFSPLPLYPSPSPTHGGSAILREDGAFVALQLPDGTNEGLPVIVWIHGGGFRRGSANQYGTGHLVDKKVVVVTVQYRLGSLGEQKQIQHL